ncbi:Aste57867_20749 [Aphanomyces stellatus]|uniref:Aste57867_20749 protein n=1 Tax=Aphanomyces stellatus TaxID=120398 RepID=A0A485LFU5_9STRA|nr:hypothetical protein As57867_020681 [Aphanomyces stellatus]VFT97428.1 Aste57867_20749 [Aphanomyces stellatus]
MSMYSPRGMTEVIVTRRSSFNGLSSTSIDYTLVACRPSRNSCDSSSVHGGTLHDFPIVSTAGVVYDSIHVMDKAVVAHGTVYYLLHVASQASPLENYTIRRRYNDFKSFHATLSRYMPPAPVSLFKGHTQSIDEDSDASTFFNAATTPTEADSDDGVVYLPPMPHGGLLAIMTSKENLVRSRIAQFNRILQAALDAASPDVADALRTFIKEAPGGPSRHHTTSSSFLEASAASSADYTIAAAVSSSQYVSLRDYVVPELCMKTEREARRRTASFGRQKKAPATHADTDTASVGRDSTTSTSSACVA